MKPIQKKFQRNEQARALRARAGNAGVAIHVDTLSKVQKPKKGTGSYRRPSKPECREIGSTSPRA
jgi:stalled ribosome alternative rescue factor ArfA